MQLNVKERLVLPSMLQEKGSLSEQMTKESIIRKIALTDDEKEAFMVKYNETGTITWNPNIDTNVEIVFTEIEEAMLKTVCLKLDKENAITMDMLSICKKILGIDV